MEKIISAVDFWNVWMNFIAPELDKFYSTDRENNFSNDKQWTKIVLNDQILELIKNNLPEENLQFRKEDYKIDVVFAGEENLIYSDKYFYPKERLVLLEHENQIDTAGEEIYKLLYRKAPLKVLVTYLYREASETDLCSYLKKFRALIKESNDWFQENKNTKYLLIIGHGKEKNNITWYAYEVDIYGNLTELSDSKLCLDS